MVCGAQGRGLFAAPALCSSTVSLRNTCLPGLPHLQGLVKGPRPTAALRPPQEALLRVPRTRPAGKMGVRTPAPLSLHGTADIEKIAYQARRRPQSLELVLRLYRQGRGGKEAAHGQHPHQSGPDRDRPPRPASSFSDPQGIQCPSRPALLHRPSSHRVRHRSPARTPRTRLDPQQASLTRRLTHPKIEAVEGGSEVAPGPQAVHLQGHLCEEETQENKLCKV